MRQLKPKPKERRKIPVPDELAESMREVVEVICEAERNSGHNIDFDDAIQTDCLCGGRYNKKLDRYRFTYHAAVGRWFLDLYRIQIGDIADGHQTELTLYCCAEQSCGAKFSSADQYCECDYENVDS